MMTLTRPSDERPLPGSTALTSRCLCLLGLLLSMLLLSACASNTTLKTTKVTPLEREAQEIPEAELLDVGIYQFDPGLDAANEDDKVIFPEVRNAESRFMAYRLMQTLQNSAAWGAVRVVPASADSIDVSISGSILHSDGEQLTLAIKASDATGRLWYEKEYTGLASKYAYGKQRGGAIPAEPFQSLYNDIANDLLEYRRQNFSSAYLRKVRTTAQLKFAQEFSPEAFSGHLSKNKQGELEITRLPADDDPMLQRIQQIRERDYLFVDTLQDYYGAFVREMDDPYREWRGQSYNEVVALRKLKRDARRQTILGIAAIIGGIAASGSDNGSTRTAGAVAVGAGGYMVKSGFDKRAEAEMHVEALQELGDSLEAAIEPQIIELEDRTITLSGSVENQYQQWRDILREIYRAEVGIY